MYPRDAAGSFKVPATKDGAIQRLVPLGDHMEIYTPEETFRMQTPESIDPGRTNPNTMFVNVKIADVGSSSPFVARTLLMAHDMLKDRTILQDDERRLTALKLVHRIKASLLHCDRASDELIRLVNAQCENFEQTEQAASSRTYTNFPIVPDLDAKVTAFLIPARRVITDICQIPQFFWKLSGTHSSLDYLLDKEIAPLLGEDHHMVQWFRKMIPGITRIVNFRNGQEHAGTTKGLSLVTRNFEMLPTNEVHIPVWHLEGERPSPIAEEMPRMVNLLLHFAETMLVACVDANLPTFPPMIVQPIEKPDPLCPICYELIIDASRLSFPESGDRQTEPHKSRKSQ
ncbi:hypothetical protein [Caballeronia sp. ATUFL_M2_KS44]|uniref:hypothetical protein n=1 Tax=Caballeronia sp. ATUFL_M2_KS44 TaxID=2921767 RepID=UPI0020298258|nr:hypothetical protein [Caballeronia sp. ATUFL_M2_KS44]